jgi:hypothetical protein
MFLEGSIGLADLSLIRKAYLALPEFRSIVTIRSKVKVADILLTLLSLRPIEAVIPVVIPAESGLGTTPAHYHR